MVKQPLSEAEVRALAARMGGVRGLIAPKRKGELEALGDEELVKHLAENPNHVRRPLIDTGSQVLGGFTAEVRAALEKQLKK
ncbi:arsenate reductase [Archangium gephyra]|uniref:Arsenate reductase n=1 Tax=Archangium gephyra TaxID=48 RepID=A0ABX9JXA1_9BACT|nr:arsenate reductase [Archangium gephyra]